MVESDDDDKKGSDNASIVETAAASKKSSEKPVLKRPRTSMDGEYASPHIIIACNLIFLLASSRPRQRQAMSSDISRQVSQALSVTGLRDKLDTGSARSKRPSPASSTRLTRHSSRSGADASRRSTPIDRPVAGPSGTSDDVDIQWDASIPPAAAPPPQNIVKESD